MIAIDWMAVGLGMLAGSLAGALFFLGLALSIWVAMRTPRPATFLMLSGLLRICALLGVCWLIANLGGGLMLAGFALAFVIVRMLAVTIAHAIKPKQVPQWN
jgi:F1F0 ATPase subunit 2